MMLAAVRLLTATVAALGALVGAAALPAAGGLVSDASHDAVTDPLHDVSRVSRRTGAAVQVTRPRPTVDATRFSITYASRAVFLRTNLVNLRPVPPQGNTFIIRSPRRSWYIYSETLPGLLGGVVDDTSFTKCFRATPRVKWAYRRDFVRFRIPLRCFGPRSPSWVRLDDASTVLYRRHFTYEDKPTPNLGPKVYRPKPGAQQGRRSCHHLA